MDGPKRLAFTTLDPGTKETKKDKKVEKTVRLEVDLLESTDTTYPEFSYTDLVKSTAGVANRSSSNNSEDPFNDGDEADEVAAIAKRLEEKYNKPDEGKKKKKRKWQEDHYMLELGDGYDENDTFIDNSEAFDEILPENMTTKLGGFYINSGRLIFKEMSDDSEDDFQPEIVKKSKKRRISSDEDDSDSEDKGQVVKKKKTKESLDGDGEVKKKKKKKIIPPGEGKPFKKPKQIQDKDKKKENKSSTVAALIKSSSPNLNGEGQENGVGSPSENGDHGDHQSVTDAIEAVATGKEDSNSQDAEEPQKDVAPESIPKLPTNLPADVDAKIAELKKQAKASSTKSKFFTTEVNKILLEIEISSKQMTVSNRSAVFGHLAAFLPCTKDTLMKRAKMLRVKDLEDKIKEPIEKLTKTVNRLMPSFQEKYDEECKKFAQEKLANEQKGQQEKEETTKDKEENQTESDEDEPKGNQSDNTKKRQNGPRKKFEWDNLTRTLLCDVVRVKMQTFQLSKSRSETAEEFCKAFLESEVRPIWPKGWMQKNVLFKESRPAHHSWTNPQKTKKLFPTTKTPGSASTGTLTQKSNTTSSAPPGVSVSKLSSTNSAKNSPVDQEKSTPTVVNSSKPTVQGTPSVVVKKITPSILTYDTVNGGPRGSNISINNVPKATANSAMISNVSQKNTKINDSKPNTKTNDSKPNTKTNDSKLNTKANDSKPLTASQKQEEKSWGHIVSDILRSSYTGAASGVSPPKPSTNQQGQRQSSPSGGSSLSFMAQFEQFTKQLQPSQGGKDISASALSVAQQQLFQKQVQQRLAQDKALQQFKLLEKQSKAVQQQVLSKSESTVKSSVQQQSTAGNQSKGPGQSPMSMAMGRNPAPKVTPKQLTNVFQKSMDNVSMATGNVIRQKLTEFKTGNNVSVTMASSIVHNVVAKPSKPTDHQYGRTSSSTGPDQLRKSSPQVTLTGLVSNQAKPAQGHIIKVTTNQNVGQGQMLTKTNPSSKPVSSNGRPSPSLMLFSSPQPSLSTNSVPSSITNPGSIGGQTVRARPPGTLPSKGSTPQRSPSNVASFSGGSVGKPQGYSLPSPTIPGFPMTIPGLTSQQLATLKEEVARQNQLKLQAQQQRSGEIPLGSNRPQQGPSVPHHLSPEQHLLALQYGFSRYKDSMK